MLEVVEHQQDLLPREVGDERVLGALTGLLAHAQGDADRHRNELGIPDDEEGAVDAVLVVGEALVSRSGGELEREPRLALSAGPHDGEQACPL